MSIYRRRFVSEEIKLRELNTKQKRFCREYVKDWNGTQSAIRAGYSEETARQIGCKLLTKINVKAEIKKVCDELLGTEAEQLRYFVLNGLKSIAETDITNVINVIDGHTEILDTCTLDARTRSAIEEISESTSKEGGSIKVKMHSKTKAFELLGRYAGMFTDKIELSGAVATASLDMDPEARAKRFAEIQEQTMARMNLKK